MAEVKIPKKYRDRGYTLKDFACPRIREDGRVVAHYPVATKKTTKNAMARYRQPQTVKCLGGMRRICRAYREHGLTHTEAYEKRCK